MRSSYPLDLITPLLTASLLLTSNGSFSARASQAEVPPVTSSAGAAQIVDPQPCRNAVTAGDDERIIADCAKLLDSDRTSSTDRLPALIARAAAHGRKGEDDAAIADDSAALLIEPKLADILNHRGEIARHKGDKPRAAADFAATLRIDPQHAAARANNKALAQELERESAQMAIKNKSRAPLK